MDDGTDDDLMARAGRGDRTAFAALVERHFGRAAAIAARIVGNGADAEDVAQEALLRAWQKAPDWQAQSAAGGAARFSTWIYRVVVNLSLDRKRRLSPLTLDAADAVADSAPNGFARTAAGQIARRVQSAVAALPDRQRAAFVLCHYEEMTNIEAASVLDVSIGALESLLVRARRTLRQQLADLMETG